MDGGPGLRRLLRARARERLVVVNGDRDPKQSAWPLSVLNAHWGYDPHASDPGAGLAPGLVHRMVRPPEESAASEPSAPLSDLVAAVRAQDDAATRLETLLPEIGRQIAASAATTCVA